MCITASVAALVGESSPTTSDSFSETSDSTFQIREFDRNRGGCSGGVDAHGNSSAASNLFNKVNRVGPLRSLNLVQRGARQRPTG